MSPAHYDIVSIGRATLADAFYTARVRVEKVSGVHRLATLGDGTTFDMGVHGIIKEHYRIDAEDLPLPVDYVVGAAGGWMLGTLNGALEVREVRLEAGDIVADVEGFNEVRDGLPVLTGIHVHYGLRIPPGTREVVERALERHASKCPTAQSLRGAVDVSWTAEIEERDS